MTRVLFGVYQDPQVFFWQAAFQLCDHQLLLVPVFVPAQAQDFALLPVKFHKALISLPLQPVSLAAQPSFPPQVSPHPPSFVSSPDLLRVHTTPSSGSLIKILNRTEPSVSPWGTLIVTGFQLNFVSLISILRAWLLSQFSILYQLGGSMGSSICVNS